MKTYYCAMIGDINKSRTLEHRAAVQKKLQTAVEQINKEYKKEIASKFLITIGDEYQGLLYTPAKSRHIVRRFQEFMDPVDSSFGIGIGKLATPLLPKAALGMDGECFYRARAALLAAKKKKREMVYDFDGPVLPLVNAIVGTLEKQWDSLNETQRKIYQMRHHGEKPAAIIKKIGITKQAMYKAIEAAGILTMEESVNALDLFFRQQVRNV